MTRPSTRITINDVARLAGVSKKTVSRVINQSPLLGTATREKVELVIAETGFVPNAQARALALRRNFLVALIHEDAPDALAGFAQAVVSGIQQALQASDYAMLVRPVAPFRAATDLTRFIDQHRPAAVVLLPPLAQRADIAAVCDEAGIACIRLGPTRDRPGPAPGDRVAMAAAVHALVDLGHTRIGFVGGPEGALLAQERELGFLDAMADRELDRGALLIEPGDMSFESGLSAGRLLLAVSPRPTAIAACGDAMAAGVLRAAHEAKLAVPEDLSILGFDDTPLAAVLSPALTSVHVPWAAIARDALAALLFPDRAPPPEAQAPAFRIIARASTGPAPQSALRATPRQPLEHPPVARSVGQESPA